MLRCIRPLLVSTCRCAEGGRMPLRASGPCYCNVRGLVVPWLDCHIPRSSRTAMVPSACCWNGETMCVGSCDGERREKCDNISGLVQHITSVGRTARAAFNCIRFFISTVSGFRSCSLIVRSPTTSSSSGYCATLASQHIDTLRRMLGIEFTWSFYHSPTFSLSLSLSLSLSRVPCVCSLYGYVGSMQLYRRSFPSW